MCVVGAGHSGLMPANLTTLPHLSVSSAMSFPNVAGDPPARHAQIRKSRLYLGVCRIALVSLLSLSMISIGVFLGTLKPSQTLAS